MIDWGITHYDDRPFLGPPCPGPTSHAWRLNIEEGKMSLSSGCSDCDESVMGPYGGEDVHMVGTLTGTLNSHLETYPGGPWGTTEYDHWWEFVPTAIELEID